MDALVKNRRLVIQLLTIFVYFVQEVQDRVRRVVGKEWKEELMKVRKEIVDFHGEMVLLENYSALNYTGIYFIII